MNTGNHFKGTLLAVFLLVLVFSINPSPGLFARDQQKDILKFGPDDSLETIRMKIEHNGYQFTVDHNWVFDMDPEMKKGFFSRHPSDFPREVSYDMGPLADQLGKRQLPTSFDWRNYGGRSYIGPIQNQGNCGSCYAFGACAAAEGTYNWALGLYDGNCVDFSEAFIAFCLSDVYSGFNGCSGANYDYDELQALVDYGICYESIYLYTDVEQSCQSPSWSAPMTRFSSWHRIDCSDIDAIKTAMMNYGVVDVAVYVGSAFVAYSSGIYEDLNTACPGTPCSYTITNHAVALVGWNDNGDPYNDGYWILRNSWGNGWGEGGYMRIKYHSAAVACAATYMVFTPPPTPTPEVKPYISAFKSNSGSFRLDLYSKPEIGDWTYWDAAARNPSPLMTDANSIPSGDVIASTDADIDGDGKDELLVLKRDSGSDMNLYLYERLRPPNQPNKFPIAYDFWIIPARNNILMMANPGDVNEDGRDDLAVLKREGSNDYNLYIYNSPFRGDFTYTAAQQKNSVPIAYDKWIIPQGNDIVSMTGVDLDGDSRNDGLAVVRNQSGDYNLYVWNRPAHRDWFYFQARARQTGYGGPGTPQARDLWVIPSGNNIVSISPVHYQGTSECKLAVVKNTSGDQNLYIYNNLVAGDRNYWDAKARNPSPMARDLWIIPSRNGIANILSTD